MGHCQLVIKQLSSVELQNLESKCQKLSFEVISTRANSLMKSLNFSAETELWQFSNGNNKVINTLRSADFIFGIGIYPVNSDYCRKN